jgi:hypothetical protein
MMNPNNMKVSRVVWPRDFGFRGRNAWARPNRPMRAARMKNAGDGPRIVVSGTNEGRLMQRQKRRAHAKKGRRQLVKDFSASSEDVHDIHIVLALELRLFKGMASNTGVASS